MCNLTLKKVILYKMIELVKQSYSLTQFYCYSFLQIISVYSKEHFIRVRVKDFKIVVLVNYQRNFWASVTIISLIQFWSGFIPVNEGGRIYPTLPAISPTPTLHLAQFFASSFKPTLLLSFSTCDIHVFLGPPRFLFPFTTITSTLFHLLCVTVYICTF